MNEPKDKAEDYLPVIIQGTEEVDWKATGRRDGQLLEQQEVDAKEGAIGLFVELAEKLVIPSHGDKEGEISPAGEAWLTGYGEARGKSRKSEAKAVFDACAKDLDATETAALEVVGKGVGKDSRYTQFIDKCRDIRGRKAGGRKGGEKNSITPAQVDTSVKLTEKMDGTQAAQVMQAAALRVSSLHMPDIMVVRQINTLAEGMRNNSKEAVFVAFATKIADQAQKLLTRHQEELDKTLAKKSEAAESKGVVPTPALQGRKEEQDNQEAAAA